MSEVVHRLADALAIVEDDLARLRQLGLAP
jgi:hypothetical protein